MSKWPPLGNSKNCCVHKNSEIIQILLSHSPRYGDVLVIYFKVLHKFKMAAMDQFYIFCGPNTQNWSHN